MGWGHWEASQRRENNALTVKYFKNLWDGGGEHRTRLRS